MVMMGKACCITFFFVGIAFIFQKASAKPVTGGAGPSYGYTDPATWGKLAPGYKLCSTGTRQSPIDIDTKKVVINKQLQPHRENVEVFNATLVTNGLALQVSLTGKTDMVVDGVDYRLLHLRWHTPSEHFIDGVQNDAEMHQMYVARDGSGRMAIIATLYQSGPQNQADPIIDAITPEMTRLAGIDGLHEMPISKKFTSDLINKIPSDKYLRYFGSLTSPPCTEQVTWFIVPTVLPISMEQVDALHGILSISNKKNARPVQPLNGRVVLAVGSAV